MASSRNSSSVSNCQGEGSRKGSQPKFSKDEEDLIARMYKLLGNRWSLIAGRIPGRSADEIKKYCKSPSFKASLGEADSGFSGDSEDYANK